MKKVLYLFLCVFFLTSCGVQYKQVPYFQDLPVDDVLEENIDNYKSLEIQKGNILAITVSSLNTEASAVFNSGNDSFPEVGSSGVRGASNAVNGFLVDQNGEVQLPIVGSIRVVNLTSVNARQLIQSRLSPFLKEPVVTVRLVNLKVSVIGDVARPGVFPIQNERLSVTEALSMAGDLNITALRKNVLLIREVEGKRQYVRLDLQKKDLFNQPYYYLRNNDVLYVQPGNAKYASVDSSYRNISVILSALSLIALLITQL